MKPGRNHQRRSVMRISFGLPLLVSLGLAVLAAPSAAMKLKRSVIGNGGGPDTNGDITLNGTVGQPVDQYGLRAGAPFAPEEAAGNFAPGIHSLFELDG